MTVFVALVAPLAVQATQPDCFQAWLDCWKRAEYQRKSCYRQCDQRHGGEAEAATRACNTEQLQCKRRFRKCLNGPYRDLLQFCGVRCWSVVIAPPCDEFDRDKDGDVDLADYAELQRDLVPPFSSDLG